MKRRRILLITGGALVFLGCAAIGFVGWMLIGTNVIAARQQKKVVAELKHDYSTLPTIPSLAHPMPTKELGQTYGLIDIPAIHLTAPIIQGVRLDDLQHGVGHYPATVAPGRIGNFSLAGHRTTYAHPFYRINELRPGDLIHIRTQVGLFTYRVVSHQIVKPNQIQVVSRSAMPTRTSRMLTMTSCNPRYSAFQRYVVHAELVD